MSVLFIILVAVICLILIGYPMFKGARTKLAEYTEPAKHGISHNKEVLMNTLGEIEFDYQMNKLSDEDYRELKSYYSAAVAFILKEQKTNTVVQDDNKVTEKPAGYSLSELEKEIEVELKALDKQNG